MQRKVIVSKLIQDSQLSQKEKEEVAIQDDFEYSNTYPKDHPLAKFRSLLFEDLGGGEKNFSVHWFVNLHKGLISIITILMMIFYQNFNYPSFTYLIMHGTYGIVWLIKDATYPDKVFHKKCTLLSGLTIFIVLNLYLYPGWIVISRNYTGEISNLRMYTCTLVFIIGEVLMLLSDAQKYFTLKYKKGLITTGFFSKSRNPNFLGEILIYFAFAALSGSWKGFIPYFFFVTIFVPIPIYLKDISLRRKEGGEEYFKQTYLILFKFFSSDLKNNILHFGVFTLILCGIYMK